MERDEQCFYTRLILLSFTYVLGLTGCDIRLLLYVMNRGCIYQFVIKKSFIEYMIVVKQMGG